MTLAQAGGAFAFKDISQFFIGGFNDLLNNTMTRTVIQRDGIMGFHGTPQMPLFVSFSFHSVSTFLLTL